MYNKEMLFFLLCCFYLMYFSFILLNILVKISSHLYFYTYT